MRRARCATPPPKALTEQAKLLAALAAATTPAEKRDRVLIESLRLTGARIGSTLAARAEDLDLVAGELRLRHEKNDRERALCLPSMVVDLLRAHVAGRTSGPIFVGAHGEPLTPRHAARRLAGWCVRARIRVVGPHALRHAFATAVYRRSGGDLLLTKEALGHASVASTAVYAAVGPERLRRVLGAW
ncbi:MAG: tyrosine-type recombinase/integrase [Planctomycetota bacterium]